MLAAYLEQLPADAVNFDMWQISDACSINPRLFDKLPAHGCGTCGCAIGHGFALVPKAACETIDEYSARVYGLDAEGDDWHWLFGSAWAPIDNTPHGASARIRHYLENGVPENWMDQIYEQAPLCYK